MLRNGTLTSQGRLKRRKPVSIIDIGSNSVRLVVYEGLSRAPTILFNEKVLCGLGKGLAQTGKLDEEAVARARAALVRFRALSTQAGASDIHILATAAAREASNGPAFIADVEAIFEQSVDVLSGKQEAHNSALGILCGFVKPKGIMGDMGGGSLELVEIENHKIGEGITVPLGGLRLQDQSEATPEAARQIAKEELKKAGFLAQGKGQTFYAIGGTWRALAMLHVARTAYPLQVMHHYEIELDEAKRFCKRILQGDLEKMRGIEAISVNRRALIPYGAAVLSEVLRAMKPERVVISALGVREGLLYSLLDEAQQKKDPLLVAADEMSLLRARSHRHAKELVKWSGELFRALGMKETKYESRLRKASCLLADIGWRAHPDYRGRQSVDIISNAAFVGVDHPGRSYLALANYFRHEGLSNPSLENSVFSLAGERAFERAKLLGAILRVAYLFSASMSGVLPSITISQSDDGTVWLLVPAIHADLIGERLRRRVDSLAKLCGVDIGIKVVD
ncbi:MAG: exopolyphosphatase [Pseudomonadota bacterium]